jgi:hypothetical protein
MKKVLLPILVTICLFGFQKAFAQTDVTINPIGLLFGDLNIGADFAIKENFSIEGTIGYGSGKYKAANQKWSALPITATAKYYFNPNHGADKFYVDLFSRFVTRSYKANDSGSSAFVDSKSTRFGLGFGLGYKVVSAKNFVFDFGFGIGRALIDKYTFSDGNGTQSEQSLVSVMLVAKLGVGYRFGGGGSSSSKGGKMMKKK